MLSVDEVCCILLQRACECERVHYIGSDAGVH